MKKFRRLLAFVLCLALTLSGCEIAKPAASTQPQQEARGFSSMVYTRPDLEEIDRILEEACSAAETSTSLAKLWSAVGTYFTAYDEYYTASCLANIHYCMDITDLYWQEEYNFCLENTDKLESGLDTLYRALAKSPMRETLDEPENFGPDFLAQYEGESLWDETFTSLMNQEAQLQGSYYALATGVYDDAFYRDTAPELGDILVELIRVRQELASYMGYDSYPQFAYDYYHYRLFTPEEAEMYYLEIRDLLVPLYTSLDVSDLQELADTACTEEDVFSYVQTTAEAMGGDVARAFRFLDKYNLYDLTASENKYPTSFEIFLYSYAQPFVFVCPVGISVDKLTFSHEFGHFASDYLCTGSAAGVDVCEVQSQAMEYLSLIYGEEDEALLRYKMVDSLGVYVDQAALALFEQRMYALKGEDLTRENLENLYEEICRDFGLDGYGVDKRDYVTVTHLYTSPMYLPSYVISNDVALQIYQMELDHSGEGLSLYQQCLYSEDACLEDFVLAYGLEDPMAPGRIQKVRDMFRTRLG